MTITPTNTPQPLAENQEAQLLAAIVESSDDAIISKDLKGIITTWNTGAELIFGYTAKEAIGQHIFLIIPPERRHEEDMIQEKIHGGELISHYETVRVRKDQSRVEVSVTISPLRSHDGRILGASKIARDITERKVSDEKLHLFGIALEAAANGIVITDSKSVILWTNHAFEELTGYTSSEAMGQTPRILKSGKEPESRYSLLRDTISRGKVFYGELVNKRKDGTFYNEEMTITPLLGPDGAPTHFIAIKQDVTERNKAALEREELIAKLQQALSQVKTLKGLLPICATCKKIRDDSGYWSQVEDYVKDHTDANFTHGICPGCADKMMAELDKAFTEQDGAGPK